MVNMGHDLITKGNDQKTNQNKYGNKLRGETSHSTQLKLE